METISTRSSKVSTKREHLLGDGIVILLISIFGYVAAFAYESGYCGWYGIPLSFIRPDINTFLMLATSVLGFTLLIIAMITVLIFVFTDFRTRLGKQRTNLIAPYMGVFAYGILLWCASGFESKQVLIPISVLVGFLGVQFLKALRKTDSKPFWKRFEESEESSNISDNIFDYLSKQFGERTILAIGVAGISIQFCSFLGRHEARAQTEFLQLDSPQSSLVLRQYGDNLICCSFDEKTRTLHKQFYIIKEGDGSRTIFKSRKLGQLTIEP